jgi:hypothetical protein
MIRTRIVEMSGLEGVTFRRRLTGGHTALVIQTYDGGQPGTALIDRPTGTARPAPNSRAFPPEVWDEAVEATRGLPFTARGAVRISAAMAGFGQPEPDGQDDPDDLATVCSDDYRAIIEAYTDKRGQFSYALLNKDFIQFLKANRHVARMVAEGASVEAIRAHVVRAKVEWLTGARDLTEPQLARIVEMLDEISPKSVFRELDAEIRRLLAARR